MKRAERKPYRVAVVEGASSLNQRRLRRSTLALGLLSTYWLLWSMAPAIAATKNWRTDGPSQYWSNPNNWSPSGAPQNGDDLVFYDTAIVLSPSPTVNDLPSLTVHSVSFGANALFTLDWSIGGNTLGITGGFDVSATTTEHVAINCNIRLDANVVFNVGQNTSGSQLNVNGNVDLNGHTLGLYALDGLCRVSGVISGTGNLIGGGDGNMGTVQLAGTQPNTFTGTLTVTSGGDPCYVGYFGNVHLNKQGGGAVNGKVRVENGARLTLDQPEQIADNATVEVVGTKSSCFGQLIASSFHLNGQNETIASLFLTNNVGETNWCIVDTEGGTLTITSNIVGRSAAVVPIISGRLSLTAAPHTITAAGSAYAGLDIEAQIEGSGGFAKNGSQALILGGSNGFSGNIVVQAGILDARNNNSLGDYAGDTELSGGSLTVNTAAIGIERLVALGQSIGGDLPGSLLTCIGSCSWAGDVMLNTNLSAIGNIVFTGQITGVGGLGFFGGSRCQLGGSAGNTYTGVTLVRSEVLELAKSGGARAFSGPLLVGGGSGGPYEARWASGYQVIGTAVTLYPNGVVNLTNNFEDFGPVTFNGGRVETGTGEMGVYQTVTVNPTNVSAIINGRLGLPSEAYPNNPFVVGDGSADCDLIINAAIVGGGSLIKTGPGRLCLTGNNSFTGSTFVTTGILEVDYATALGANNIGQGTVVQSGATLRLGPGVVVQEPISLNGPGYAGNAALVASGTVTLQSPFASISYLNLSSPSTIEVEGAGSTLLIDGIISGTGPLTKAGAGRLVFGGQANTYSGDTVVSAGTMDLSKGQFVLSVPGNLVLGPAPPSAPAVARFNFTGSMNIGGNATVNANSLLDLNGYNQSVTALVLNDGGDVQTGAGLLSFAAGGYVQVGSQSALGSQASSTISGQLMLPPNATLPFDVAPYSPMAPLGLPPELDVPATISGAADDPNLVRARVAKNNYGQMRISGNNFNFAGTTSVNGGTLIAAYASALGTSGAGTFVNNPATLALEGNIVISGETVYINSTNSPGLDSRSGGNTWTGPINLSVNATINVNGSMLASGVIGGTGSLTKTGAGLLRFGGGSANSYSGDTFVNRGTLALQKPGSVTAIPHNIFVGNGTGAATLLQQASFSIVGQVAVNAGGLWDLTGFAEGFGSVSPPPLTLNGGGSVQTGPTGIVYLPVGGDVVVNPAPNTTSQISGNIGLDAGLHHFIVASGGGQPGVSDLQVTATIGQTGSAASLQKDGAGLMLLTGANSYTGTDIVAAGILEVDGSQAASVQISGGTLQGYGSVGQVNFTSTPGVVAPGASPGILSCGNFNPNISSGTFRVELNGSAPGTGYDQLNVQGSVRLTGLSLNASLGFPAGVDAQFVIINNDGTDPVTGTFNGLPEGSQFVIGGEYFHLTYFGGTGNDVVLTHLLTPHPLLAIQKANPGEVRLLWPTNAPGFTLEAATNLTGLSTWTTVSPSPTVAGTNNVVTNATTGSGSFYRLIRL